jgi:hypothetical protein
MDPAVALGSAGATVTFDLTASNGTFFVLLADTTGGPVDLFGERFLLGLSPTLVTLRAGLVPTGGTVAGALAVPPFAGVLGLVVYGQGALIDPAAQNGLFRVTNGASSALHAEPHVLVIDFDDPTASGFTGDYSTHVAGHIAGGPVTYRTHRTVDPNSYAFPQPLLNPLNPNGCREQMVFRAQDTGTTGHPELITGIRWHSPMPLHPDCYAHVELAVGHTPVVPDYSIDPWSALPMFPNSGLDPVFANNGTTQTLFAGRYDLAPSMQQPNGFVPIPLLTPFAYDGTSSVMLEFKVYPDANALGVNGMLGNLMGVSSPLPAARNTAYGGQTYPGGPINPPLDPSLAIIGAGDNWMADLEIDFARVTTVATSPMLDSGAIAPDYHGEILAAALPPGTRINVAFRGYQVPGAQPTAWSPHPDVADGRRFLQFRVTFEANLVTGEVPILDTLVVPFH